MKRKDVALNRLGSAVFPESKGKERRQLSGLREKDDLAAPFLIQQWQRAEEMVQWVKCASVGTEVQTPRTHVVAG